MKNYLGLSVFFSFIIGTQLCLAFDTGISSMVLIDKNTYLTLSDRKHSHKESVVLANTQPRFGIVSVEKSGVSNNDLYVTYPLTMSDMPPNDLEAVCALPHRKHELLVAESGFYEGRYGRVFHMRLREKNDTWKGKLLSAFRPFSQQDSTYSTPKAEQIEGMACIENPEDQIMVILALRGENNTPGMLIWGMLEELDEEIPVFRKLGEAKLSDGQSSLGDRDASDLYLEKKSKKQWQIWTIAVDGAGEDFGPFRSVIYTPGSLKWKNNEGLQFIRTEPAVGWTREGLKVEAMAKPAERITGSVFSIGTEDEALGGIWQPLFPEK